MVSGQTFFIPCIFRFILLLGVLRRPPRAFSVFLGLRLDCVACGAFVITLWNLCYQLAYVNKRYKYSSKNFYIIAAPKVYRSHCFWCQGRFLYFLPDILLSDNNKYIHIVKTTLIDLLVHTFHCQLFTTLGIVLLIIFKFYPLSPRYRYDSIVSQLDTSI